MTTKFLESVKLPVFAAIIGSTIYGLLFSLILPLAQSHETNLLYEGRLYMLAKERAQENAAQGDWNEASQLLAICEGIWPEGPEHKKLKTEADIRTEAGRLSSDKLPNDFTDFPYDPNRIEPVNATEAIAMAESALLEERYFDAHWLATLGGRLAKPGSPETAMASRLAGRAWNSINSLAPNAEESRIYSVFNKKRDGYEALLGREYIRAYFIFLELDSPENRDPDIKKYLAMSEIGIKHAAFFIDEIELSLGKILTGAIFSFPFGIDGRLVMRISSLSTSTDSAYGIGVEIMSFNKEGKPLWSLEAPYAKILPLSGNTSGAKASLSILLRALDREDKTRRWEPEIKGTGQGILGGAQIALPVSWDDFLLLSNVRRGLSGLSSAELSKAAKNLKASGYLPAVFEAELLQRFVKPMFLLPLSILAIAFGWQYRALKRPRYMRIPMLAVLPVVFYGAEQFSRSVLNELGIWAVVSVGFSAAALFFGIGFAVLLVLSLIVLASKRG
jgi:hypothetical protein